LLPLSATTSPYVFIAWKIFCTYAGWALMSLPGFSRSRAPIGSAYGLVLVVAVCEAGNTWPFVSRRVARNAWRIGSGPKTSSKRTRPGRIARPAASALVQPSGRRPFASRRKTAPEAAFQREAPASQCVP
jgi:hypothetical protein